VPGKATLRTRDEARLFAVRTGEPEATNMPMDPNDMAARERLMSAVIDLSIRLAILGLLLYWSFVLIRPFIDIAIWSVVLTVALYPIYDWMVRALGGRRWLAAVLLTIISLVLVIGPATWLALGLIDSIRTLADRFELSALALPPPFPSIKSWPLIGEPIYQIWDLASTNIREALDKITPYLKPFGTTLLQIAADAGTGTVKFFIAIIVSGFLFSPAPDLARSVRAFARRIAPARGEELTELAGATIRAISRGVIGISVLQAMLAGIGLVAAGIPGASLLTTAILILGIVQIGPSIVIIPLIAWVWWTQEATTALLFTAYMIPVNLIDNLLRPFVMGRGLDVPILVVLIGVFGGAISQGISGLFLGPIILAVIWQLMVAWSKEQPDAPAG
jgi:predicted PurR-regulated permease PerM